MPPRVDNLRESSHRVVRTVALGHLADAAAAGGRLAKETDDEALHDFRVALRRLRSWERAFRPFIRKDVSKKLRRRLRNLASDTGQSRDLEVHLAWLRDQRRAIGRRQRPGLTWLMATLAQRQADADAVLERDVNGRFSRLHSRLERALASYRETLRLHDDGRAASPSPFAEALAPRIRDAAAVLATHLARIQSAADEDECHEARIAAKRLRYLLEPIARLVPGAGEAVERLKSLQDVLGDLHDAQVFGAEISALERDVAPPVVPPVERRVAPPAADQADDPDATRNDTASETAGSPAAEAVAASAAPNDSSVPQPGTEAAVPATSPASESSVADARRASDLLPGLIAIRERLERRAITAFAQFSNEWLGDASTGFFKDVDAVADRVEAGARAGLEIERKYLLRDLPDEARAGQWMDIVQGYIPGAQLHERIRRVSVRRAGQSEHQFYRTVKLGEGVARIEIEEETTAAIFESMWPLTKGRRLRKRRYAVDVDGKTWEIDTFKNRDLVMAEIELDSEDEKVVIPKWLAATVQREVTLEPEFQNINLAR